MASVVGRRCRIVWIILIVRLVRSVSPTSAFLPRSLQVVVRIPIADPAGFVGKAVVSTKRSVETTKTTTTTARSTKVVLLFPALLSAIVARVRSVPRASVSTARLVVPKSAETTKTTTVTARSTKIASLSVHRGRVVLVTPGLSGLRMSASAKVAFKTA
jgi:hypothetical protein